MSDRLQRQIQEYLDDRMDDDVRREFETRAANEPGLARRIETERELGQALRDGVPELSEAFYTRLRGRFVERTRRRRFRPFSWEGAGLLAAAVLVLALFAPFVLERGVREPKKEEAQSSFDAPAESPSAPEPTKSIAPEPVVESESPEGFADSDHDRVAPERQRREATTAPSTAPVPMLGQAMEKRVAAGAVDSLEESNAAGARDDRASVEGGQSLPAGIVQAGEWFEISDREGWNRLARQIPGRIGDFDPSRRMVLVGPAERPLDCAAAAIVSSATVWEIRFLPSATESSAAGCVFVLPRDGRAVQLSGWPR